jgi:outer membrane protein assembly factor BamB
VLVGVGAVAVALLILAAVVGGYVLVVSRTQGQDAEPDPVMSQPSYVLGASALVAPPTGAAPALLTVREPDVVFGGSGGRPAWLVRFDLGRDHPTWEVEIAPTDGGASSLFHDGELAYVSVDSWLVAVDLDTGEERWRTELGSDLSPGICGSCFAVSDEVLMVQTSLMALHGIDRRTGRVLWTRAGWRSYRVLRSGDVTLVAGSMQRTPDEERLHRIDLRTGEDAFDVPVGCEVRQVGDRQVRPSYTLRADEQEVLAVTDTCVQSLDVATGSTRWTVRGPGPGVPTVASPSSLRRTAGRGVLVAESPTGTVIISGRLVSVVDPARTSLQPLWRAEGETTPIGVQGEAVVWLRLGTEPQSRSAIEARDIRTGEERWTREIGFNADLIEAGGISIDSETAVVTARLAGGRITLVTRSGPGDHAHLTVSTLDADTGHPGTGEAIPRPKDRDDGTVGITKAFWSEHHVLIHTEVGAHLVDLREATALTALPR